MRFTEYVARQVEYCKNPEFTRKQAEAIVRAKLHNSRIMLMRLNRRVKSDKATQAIAQLELFMEKLPFAEDVNMLRGYEGIAATTYFQALGTLVTGEFAFEKRTKRPPTDPINSTRHHLNNFIPELLAAVSKQRDRIYRNEAQSYCLQSSSRRRVCGASRWRSLS